MTFVVVLLSVSYSIFLVHRERNVKIMIQCGFNSKWVLEIDLA